MKSMQMIIYDEDFGYAGRLENYLMQRDGNPFRVSAFSKREELMQEFVEGLKEPEIMLIAENSFCKELLSLKPKHVFILNETGLKKYSEYVNFNKYQSAGELFRQIMLEYADEAEEVIPKFFGKKAAKIVGVYTPITRCLQTSFALTLSQNLGKKGKCLYLNFEKYSGFSMLFKKGYLKDLSDVVYYFNYSRDKFLYWLEGTIEHFANIDYIPPVLTATSLEKVSSDTWVDIIDFLSREAGYDYIVLDLCDNIQGVFQILDMCCRVYTITREDNASKAKLDQFKRILEGKQYLNLSNRVGFLTLPNVSPEENLLETMVYGDLYEYTAKLIEGDFDE